jgi:hypothetical protein
MGPARLGADVRRETDFRPAGHVGTGWYCMNAAFMSLELALELHESGSHAV